MMLPRPIGGTVLLKPHRQYFSDTGDLHAHSSGLFLGRDKDHPIGHVMRVAPWVEENLPQLVPGQQVLYLREEMADFYQGDKLFNRVNVRGQCPKCGHAKPNGRIIALVHTDGSLRALGSTVIVRIEQLKQSEVIDTLTAEQAPVSQIVSFGPRARWDVGKRVLWHRELGAEVTLDSGDSFAVLDTQTWCPMCGYEVSEAELLAVVPEGLEVTGGLKQDLPMTAAKRRTTYRSTLS
jgi:rubredoxin